MDSTEVLSCLIRTSQVRDHTIDAYIALLRATDVPLPNREEIKITILLDDTDGLVELQRQLCRHLINPSEIKLKNHLEGDSEPTVKERESIKNLLTNDCRRYYGIWDPTFQIPPNIEWLEVRFKDRPSLDAFCQSLEKTKKIEILDIHFSVNDVSSVSRPIPFLEKHPGVYVYVRDVKEEDIEKVGDILRALQPQDARRSFLAIEFPLCSPRRTRSPEVILRLLASLKGVRVRFRIWFPEQDQLYDEALCREMYLKAVESTGCEGLWSSRYGWENPWEEEVEEDLHQLFLQLPDSNS
ncbi:uncharacterized protein [Palaemon carinicauda]|uniref:uncharacterized protein n=1 Tax=Palaemon carinicauda TaxID=392227 RepID=UPI0035B5EF94